MPATLSTYITFFKKMDKKDMNMPELFELCTYFQTCYNVWKSYWRYNEGNAIQYKCTIMYIFI